MSDRLTVWVTEDERYPDFLVFDQDKSYGCTPILVEPETLARWRQADEDYQRAQREIEEALIAIGAR